VFPVLFVVLFFAWIYYLSAALFWILIALMVGLIIFVIIDECNKRNIAPQKKRHKKRY
jgi:ABC-type bacteriocin/lantibiotic exporter with double-glycine peptidase domain